MQSGYLCSAQCRDPPLLTLSSRGVPLASFGPSVKVSSSLKSENFTLSVLVEFISIMLDFFSRLVLRPRRSWQEPTSQLARLSHGPGVFVEPARSS